MADGILAAVNENGNIDRFIDTKGGVHYIEPKRYEESVAKIDAAATKAQETVNSATEAVSECKAQTGACTQETARAKEIADTVESRITGIEGDVATLRDSVSPRVLSSKRLQSGGSVDVPTLSEWLVIGALVSMAATDNSDKEVMVPCYVGDKFASGSSGCAVGSSPRYVAVKMLVSGTVIKYDSCILQDMVGGKILSSRSINGIVGLIRR